MNCPRGMNPRHHEVFLSNHAWGRWLERSETKHKGKAARNKLARAIRALLNEAIHKGIEIDNTGAGWVDLGEELYAGVVFDDKGWVIFTITTLEEKNRPAERLY